MRHARCSLKRFLAWMAPWAVLLGLGLYAFWLCLAEGLNQTAMDNRFAFGLWIFVDLAVIALGAGAFFSGFLLYVLRVKEVEAVIRHAVVVGFLCYSGAVGILMLDVGQPLRAWFTFWHPNVHSMLTEVTFCITCYLAVLSIEYVPLILSERRLKRVPGLVVLGHEMHRLMPLFAGVGAFLSFFHQGSLGGLYGVLRGRPFAFREGFALWPSTFFLFVLSAAASGPCFLALTSWVVSRVSGRRLVKPETLALLGRISGRLLVVYVGLKAVDTLVWINRTAPATGVHPFAFYSWQPFGSWILLSEIVLFGLVPALVLLDRRRVADPRWMLGASVLACSGVVVNRFVMTIQTLSLPTLAFEPFRTYLPSWQEVAAFGGVVGYAVLVYSLSFRYLPMFPQERAEETGR